MATVIHAQCSWQVASMLPKDVHVINPYFEVEPVVVGDEPDWQTLSDDLANALQDWNAQDSTHQLTVKLYEVGLPKPNRPKATTIRSAGQANAIVVPPELCVCLSFYGDRNAPNQRGRLYLPFWALTTGTPSMRPSGTDITRACELGPFLADLGGINVDWVVYSPTKNDTTKVDTFYADDEFDVQRRRGLRPTQRNLIATGG